MPAWPTSVTWSSTARWMRPPTRSAPTRSWWATTGVSAAGRPGPCSCTPRHGRWTTRRSPAQTRCTGSWCAGCGTPASAPRSPTRRCATAAAVALRRTGVAAVIRGEGGVNRRAAVHGRRQSSRPRGTEDPVSEPVAPATRPMDNGEVARLNARIAVLESELSDARSAQPPVPPGRPTGQREGRERWRTIVARVLSRWRASWRRSPCWRSGPAPRSPTPTATSRRSRRWRTTPTSRPRSPTRSPGRCSPTSTCQR